MTAVEYIRAELGPEFSKLSMDDKKQLLDYAREEMATLGIEATKPTS